MRGAGVPDHRAPGARARLKNGRYRPQNVPRRSRLPLRHQPEMRLSAHHQPERDLPLSQGERFRSFRELRDGPVPRRRGALQKVRLPARAEHVVQPDGSPHFPELLSETEKIGAQVTAEFVISKPEKSLSVHGFLVGDPLARGIRVSRTPRRCRQSQVVFSTTLHKIDKGDVFHWIMHECDRTASG